MSDIAKGLLAATLAGVIPALIAAGILTIFPRVRYRLPIGIALALALSAAIVALT